MKGRSRKKKKIRKEPIGLKIKSAIANNRQVIRFWLIFLAILLPLHLLYSKYFDSNVLNLYARSTASVFSALLRVFGVNIHTEGIRLWVKSSVLDITPACTNIFVFVVYASAVLAYPAKWSKKCLGLLYGLVITYFINLIRLGLSVMGIGISGQAFDLVHGFLWPMLFVIFGIAIWVWWIDWLTKPKTRTGVLLFTIKMMCWATIFSFIWLLVSKYYMGLLLRMSASFLNLIGCRIAEAGLAVSHSWLGKVNILFRCRGIELWLTWIHPLTFNIVLFIALNLATPNVKIKKLIRPMIVGLLILFLVHFLRIVIPAAIVFLGMVRIPETVLELSNVAIIILPFLLWLLLTYRKIIKLTKTTER